MAHFFEHLNVLVMPTNACNMNCVYCFHKQHYENSDFMNLETIKQLFSITLPFYKKVTFLWHGGEPMLMGQDFYKSVLSLQKGSNCKIINSMQTNLTLMNPEFAAFMCDNGISVSGSYDGIRNADLRGNDEAILRGRKMILDRGGRCGTIMVVSQRNIDNLIESYNFFKENQMNYSLNFYVPSIDSRNPSLELHEDEAIWRMKEFYDYWRYDRECNIEVSFFRQLIDFILFRKKTLCSFTSCLGRWVGVRHDGEIVPCNRYFPPKYSFGNVFDYSNIRGAFESEGFVNILSEAIIRRDKCKSCEIYDFCNGGCNHVSYNETGIENNEGVSCKILKSVYLYIKDSIDNLTPFQVKPGIYNPRFEELIRNSLQKLT
ncbi:radical SAM/SPASM domain-containing protein [Anaerospora sp.]|uniref:radical SAM/SPASM domain-containing protein n=1 Tax=Anaerospora sp. TaxID=1960278 RepID=UPI0028A28C04|nr:radical SAM protein [Anaerospora sp.]